MTLDYNCCVTERWAPWCGGVAVGSGLSSPAFVLDGLIAVITCSSLLD
jgi:hypothetical protein